MCIAGQGLILASRAACDISWMHAEVITEQCLTSGAYERAQTPSWSQCSAEPPCWACWRCRLLHFSLCRWTVEALNAPFRWLGCGNKGLQAATSLSHPDGECSCLCQQLVDAHLAAKSHDCSQCRPSPPPWRRMSRQRRSPLTRKLLPHLPRQLPQNLQQLQPRL